MPIKIIKYLSKEFLDTLIVVFFVFLSLALLINFVEEMIFFKSKNLDNFFTTVSYLTLARTPNTLMDLSIFIFLFSGIFFFDKIVKNNELNTALLSGISRITTVMVPSFISFFLGILIILMFTPISAASLKFYEKTKRLYSQNENLIVINNTGLWFVESAKSGYNIIRADKISNNDFLKLKNVTIYNLDNKFNFMKRYDAENAIINNRNWSLKNVKILNSSNINKTDDKKLSNLNTKFISSININDLKNFFSNAGTVSFWNILNNIKVSNERGYSGDELKVQLHKYLSLPIYLFATILISTIFTLGIKKNYSSFVFLFFGIMLGLFIYFLNDLSVAIGLSNIVPINIAVWSPTVLLLLLSIINLIKINEQ
jgi:lipopolysaccharide export system permease protein